MTDKAIIIGKPNVGKSSIFNALVNKKVALVDNYPGLTRDLRKKNIINIKQIHTFNQFDVFLTHFEPCWIFFQLFSTIFDFC